MRGIKFFGAILLVSIGFNGFGQKKLKREISVFAMPMFVNKSLSVNGVPEGQTGTATSVKDSLMELDQGRLALGGGVGISFYRDAHSRFETGFRFSDQGFTRQKFDLGFGEVIHPEIGVVKDLSQTGSPKDVHFHYRYQYLQIPFLYHFTPYTVKKLADVDFYITVGASANILLKHTVRAKYQGWTAYGKEWADVENHEYKPAAANLNLHFGLNLHYDFDNRTSLVLNPTLGLGILNANDGIERHRLYDLSIPIGVVYKLDVK